MAERDFTSFSGIIKTFAYEIIDRRSELHKTWIEYISSTLSKVNEKYAKKNPVNPVKRKG